MQLFNTNQSYGTLTIFLHWLMAILVIGMICVGLYMVSLPLSTFKFTLYGWHKAFGFLVLGLVIARLLWRLCNIIPSLSIPQWEKRTALSVHWILYGFMFALPITGWLLTSAAGFPVSFFGLFIIPNLLAPDDQLRVLFESIHHYLGFALIAIIALHTAAALKHHLIDKDDILRRML
jgi:cytochrome b561